MKIAGWITIIYALIILAGGIIGQIQADSITSLVMGTIFGVLLLFSAIGMLKDRLFPSYMGILLTLILDAFFTYRYLLTFTFIPAGLMCLISLIVLIAIATLIRNHLQQDRGD